MAQTPLPSEHPIKEVEEQLKTREQREKELRQELKNIKSELVDKKKEMLSLAQNIKSNEKELIELEERIGQKRQEQNAIEARLNADRGAISDLVLALQRVKRVPPEALLARPGAPLETAQSAMLLQSILPRIYGRAEGLRMDLESLTHILEALKNDRAEVIKKSKTLSEDQKKLAGLLSQREKIYSKTAQDVKREQAELKKISEQATSLKDLVARIEKKQREEDARAKSQKTSLASVGNAAREIAKVERTPIPRAGEAQLPISGIIKTGYGKSDDIGAVSQGLTIAGREKSLIVAPMGGVVDYAGYFKGYGQIIILKHQKGYHSLIAGLDKIDTVVGRAVSAGEPIGYMGKTTDGQPPSLYYELRYNGQPVNPSKKISGLR